MKIVFSLITIITLITSCGQKTFWITPRDSTTYPYKVTDYKFDLSSYDIYRCAIYRDKQHFNTPNHSTTISKTNHLVDLRYVALNRTNNTFFYTSAMPIRFSDRMSPVDTFYLDKYASQSDTSINFGIIDNFIFGKIKENKLLINLPTKKTAYKQIREFYFSLNDKHLTINDILYHKGKGISAETTRKNENPEINTALKAELWTFEKIDDPSFLFSRNTNNAISLKNDVFINSKPNSNNKTRIHFTPKTEKDVKSFYFQEKGNRFNFIHYKL